jgi:hypothetical protein
VSYCTPQIQVKARKPHRCSWCGEAIPTGEFYTRWYSVNEDGHGATSKMHGECVNALEEEGEGEYMPHENERPPRLIPEPEQTTSELCAKRDEQIDRKG